MSLRQQNLCSSCSYTWYPKGKNLSNKCPNCGSRSVTYAPTATGCLSFLLVGAAVVIASALIIPNLSNTTSSNKAETKPSPVPTPTASTMPSDAGTNGNPSVASPIPVQSTPEPAPRFPRTVIAKRDLIIPLKYGTLNIKKGQQIKLIRQSGPQLQATFGSIDIYVKLNDVEEETTNLVP